MNIDRMHEVRDRSKAERDHFQMALFFSRLPGAHREDVTPRIGKEGNIDWCGTSCCVAGFAVTLFPNPGRFRLKSTSAPTYGFDALRHSPSATAASLLGLEKWQAEALFCGFVDDEYFYQPENISVEVHRDEGVGLSDEELTLRYLDALIEAGEFFYPHKRKELFPEVTFHVT